MNNEIKEIYLSNLKWTKTHNNTGGVMGNIVFKDNMSYEEYNKLFKSGYFIICDKDYITNLQEENKTLKELNVCVGCNNNPDYKTRIDKAIEYLKNNACFSDKYFCDDLDTYECKELFNILQGSDKE